MVKFCDFAAPPGKILQPRKPGGQNRRLQLIETAVQTEIRMMIAVALSVIAQAFRLFGNLFRVGDERAAIAERAQILRRIKTEGAPGAESSRTFPAIGREMSLGAIFQE